MYHDLCLVMIVCFLGEEAGTRNGLGCARDAMIMGSVSAFGSLYHTGQTVF